jgi:hypothetical protein
MSRRWSASVAPRTKTSAGEFEGNGSEDCAPATMASLGFFESASTVREAAPITDGLYEMPLIVLLPSSSDEELGVRLLCSNFLQQ